MEVYIRQVVQPTYGWDYRNRPHLSATLPLRLWALSRLISNTAEKARQHKSVCVCVVKHSIVSRAIYKQHNLWENMTLFVTGKSHTGSALTEFYCRRRWCALPLGELLSRRGNNRVNGTLIISGRLSTLKYVTGFEVYKWLVLQSTGIIKYTD